MQPERLNQVSYCRYFPAVMTKILLEKAGAQADLDSPGMAARLRSLLAQDISFGRAGLSLQRKQTFYGDLGVLLESGIDIKTAFDIMYGNVKRQKDRRLFADIRDKLISGSSLSLALSGLAGWTVYETVSIRIGEESGCLAPVLLELERYYGRRVAQNRKVSGAFSYPAIVILTAIAAVFFMMRFVVPMFEDVFARFNGELPGLTRFMIMLSHNTGRYMLVILLVVTLLLAIIVMNRKKRWYRRVSSALLLRIPFFGPLVLKMQLARFCMSAELLIRSFTPLQQTLSLISGMITFYPLQQALLQVENDIMGGMPLYKSMSRLAVFEARMVSLIRVGEEVNQLAPMLARIRKMYDDEVDHRSAIIGTVMEPLIIIVIGLVVGLVLVSMYLPMFKMSTTMAG